MLAELQNLLQLPALGILLAAAGWLALVSLVMAFRPHLARRVLGAMGSTAEIHFGEHILRAIVGLALIVRASHSQIEFAFFWGGWFVLLSSILIMAVPRGLHHLYAQWWAERIPITAYPILAPFSLAGAGALAFCAW